MCYQQRELIPNFIPRPRGKAGQGHKHNSLLSVGNLGGLSLDRFEDLYMVPVYVYQVRYTRYLVPGT